jgi:hypothetical protein
MGLTCALSVAGQSVRRAPSENKPECAKGAICFSGEVAADQEFRRKLTSELEFVLEPGWKITVVPARPEGDCTEFTSVVALPLRGHGVLLIDTSYGWTAEQEVATSPREFRFVKNCADRRVESDRLAIVLWPYTWPKKKYEEALDKFGSSPAGTGRFWITDSRIRAGKIEWMKFSVEIRLR